MRTISKTHTGIIVSDGTRTNLLDQDIWKNDGITRHYKKDHADILNAPSRMSISDLATTCTYCNNWDNPYAKEIVRRAGLQAPYNNSRSSNHKREIFNKACAKYGIRMY